MSNTNLAYSIYQKEEKISFKTEISIDFFISSGLGTFTRNLKQSVKLNML